MTNSLKFILSALLLLSAVPADAQPRPTTAQPAAWDGAALLAKADQSLKALPAKEASELRALLVSTGASRYDDRAGAWIKSSTKDDLKPVADYALASLRAMAEAGDAEGMYFLHYVLVMRIATAEEGFQWLEKSAERGYPHAVFEVTKKKLQGQPEKLRAAMEDFSKQTNTAGLQALLVRLWLREGAGRTPEGRGQGRRLPEPRQGLGRQTAGGR